MTAKKKVKKGKKNWEKDLPTCYEIEERRGGEWFVRPMTFPDFSRADWQARRIWKGGEKTVRVVGHGASHGPVVAVTYWKYRKPKKEDK